MIKWKPFFISISVIAALAVINLFFIDHWVKRIVEKSLEAAGSKKVTEIVAGGGVCANQFLRKSLTESAEKKGIRTWFPPQIQLILDNAGMIARRGYEIYRQSPARAGKFLRLTGTPNLAMGQGHGKF